VVVVVVFMVLVPFRNRGARDVVPVCQFLIAVMPQGDDGTTVILAHGVSVVVQVGVSDRAFVRDERAVA